VQALQRPAHVFGRGVASHAVARDALGVEILVIERPSRLAGDVEKPLMVDPERIQQLVDPPHAQASEVSQR
jgi:hypothetical protein